MLQFATHRLYNLLDNHLTLWTSHVGSSRNEKWYEFSNIGKSLFKRLASHASSEELIQSASLIYKYFGRNANSALALIIIGTNIFLGYMVPLQQSTLRIFIDIAIKNPHAFHTYAYPLLRLIGIILSCAVMHCMNAGSCKKLKEDLTLEMQGDFSKSWFTTNAFAQYSKTDTGQYLVNPSTILVYNIGLFCQDLIGLTNSFLSVLSHCIGALSSLYLASGWVELSIMSLTLNIPYLIVICLIYSYVYNVCSSQINTIVKTYIQEKNNIIPALNKKVNDTHSQSRSIAFRDGGSFEYEKYKNVNESIGNIDRDSLWPQILLSFLNKFHLDLSMLIGIIAQLLKGDINPIDTLSCGTNFAYVVKLFCFKKDNLDTVVRLKTSTKRLLDMLKTIDEFQDLVAKSKVQYLTANGNSLLIDLEIPLKDSSESFILKKELQPGKYRLIGISGAGKTTLFEVLKTKINPTFASGKVSFPAEKNVLFLPQIPHIIKSKDHSLIETILYPSVEKPSQKIIHDAKELLKTLGFENSIVNQLTEIGQTDWEQYLSPGQKQKIAIISAIIKQPHLLFLDEPFASMDEDSRNAAIGLLNDRLPNEIIILYIWHKNKTNKNTASASLNDAPIQIIEEGF